MYVKKRIKIIWRYLFQKQTHQTVNGTVNDEINFVNKINVSSFVYTTRVITLTSNGTLCLDIVMGRYLARLKASDNKLRLT